MSLKVPNISIIIGEGGSGGAIALASSNKVIMLEHSIYSVISPEGCASILWRDAAKAPDAAEALKITGPDLLSLGVVDEVLKEPAGGNNWAPLSRDSFKGVIQAVDISENFKEDETLFIATTDGAFKSINAGETWENISENYFQSRILEITSSPNFANDKTIYIGTLGDFIYKSVEPL